MVPEDLDGLDEEGIPIATVVMPPSVDTMGTGNETSAPPASPTAAGAAAGAESAETSDGDASADSASKASMASKAKTEEQRIKELE